MDAGEFGFMITSKGRDTADLYLHNSSQTLLASVDIGAAYARFRLDIDPNTGLADFYYKTYASDGTVEDYESIFNNDSWTEIGTGLNLGTSYTAGDSDIKNPNNWDAMMMHFEGTTAYLDNIQITTWPKVGVSEATTGYFTQCL